MNDILIEDHDTSLHFEHDGPNVRATVSSDEDAGSAPFIVMTRAEARKLARDLLEMTK